MLLTRKEFIHKYEPVVRSAIANTGLFAETVFSQAIVESQGKVNGTYYPGQSKLARLYNNYFGIKANKGYIGPKVNLNTGEYDNSGNFFIVGDWFRTYDSFTDSVQDYVLFLKKNPRYKDVFKAKNWKAQIKELQRAGYATNPNYSTLLITVGDSLQKWLTGAVNIVKNNPGTTAFILLLTFFF